MSNLLKQKHSLAKLRKELEGKKRRLSCNCRNKGEGKNRKYHDLAKQLSQYLYFFSFSLDYY